ncbi:MAG TPA: MFS transporter [Candidatus Eisenbacteria bacterium]|nr:MFS transporter [Candidatus Eisenbacteria bacterium]
MRSPSRQEHPDPAAPDHSPGTPARRWSVGQFASKFRALEALRHRNYRLIWYGQIFSSMGTWMDQVTRGWLIYELTNSALQLGLVRGIQAIPFLLLSPIAGSTADRYSRKKQVVLAQFANGTLYAATAALIFTGAIEPWHVYVTALCAGIAQVFVQPARAAMISDSVPPENLTNAIGLNAVIFNVARSTGPALAGILIAGWGTGSAYFFQGLFFLLAALWTTRVQLGQGVTAGGSHSRHQDSFIQSIFTGWKFSWRNEAVRSSLLVVMFASLFVVPFTTLLPVFARDIWRVGASGQGLLLTAMGVGALCSAMLIAAAGDRLPRGLLMLGGVAVYGLMNVAFAASPWFALSLFLMTIVGLCHVHSHALVQTVIQSYSPAELRGRAIALFHMSQVVMTFGSMLFGALSSMIGARWTVAVMGALGTIAMAGIHVALPRTRAIR